MSSEMPNTARFDDTALREFLAADYPRIVTAVGLVAGSRAGAEDAVAEALARAWERSDRGEVIASVPAWVTRVALNLATSRWRRLRVEKNARDRLAPAAIVSGPEDGIDIERALATLPRREREVTVLRYYLDLDVAGIAATLGISEGTVKTLLFRARKHLAAALGEHDLEEATDR
ncbi:MAG: sigma-70 family RNA polymerase sigma factor [Actinomycetota bacterium]